MNDFYDNGLRNAVIDDFRPINSRQDKGALWENFLISERLKSNVYNGNPSKSYIWRTTSQQEIDYVEVLNDSIKAYEFKWNIKVKTSIPKTFKATYNTKVAVINTTDFRDFLLK